MNLSNSKNIVSLDAYSASRAIREVRPPNSSFEYSHEVSEVAIAEAEKWNSDVHSWWFHLEEYRVMTGTFALTLWNKSNQSLAAIAMGIQGLQNSRLFEISTMAVNPIHFATGIVGIYNEMVSVFIRYAYIKKYTKLSINFYEPFTDNEEIIFSGLGFSYDEEEESFNMEIGVNTPLNS